MNIPTREGCDRLLQKYHFPESKRQHAELVEKVASYLGKKLKVKGKKLDLNLISAGALLHDVDKGVMEEGDIHAVKGEKILSDEGYPEVARICVTHRVDAFLKEETKPKTWEEKIVALADKMATKEIITVDERFKRWFKEMEEMEREERNKPLRDLNVLNKIQSQREIFEKTYPLVKELEKEILGVIGIGAEEVKNSIC